MEINHLNDSVQSANGALDDEESAHGLSLPNSTRVSTQPYYQDDLVTLYHGDCLEILDWLAADVLVTDPPYGIGWTRGVVAAAHGCKTKERGIKNDHSVSVRDNALVLWGSEKAALVFGSLKAEYPAGWHRMLVFQKPDHVGIFGNRFVPWVANWEPVFVLGKWAHEGKRVSAVVPTSEKTASGYSGYATRAKHPHAKPEDVMRELLRVCPRGTVADPFAGAGATLVAAKQLGRRAVGVEIEERYCEIAARRLRKLDEPLARSC